MQIWHCSIYQRIYWVFALTMLLCFTVVSFNRSLNIYDLKKKKVGHIDLKSFKELCTPMEHMPGRWVAQPDLGIRFPCCGYYTNDSAEECQQKDTYLREDGFQYGDNELYAVIGGNGCLNDLTQQVPWRALMQVHCIGKKEVTFNVVACNGHTHSRAGSRRETPPSLLPAVTSKIIQIK